MQNDIKTENVLPFKVDIVESESGWGSRLDEVKSFATKIEAEEFIKKYNSKNNLPVVPSWYMYATPSNF